MGMIEVTIKTKRANTNEVLIALLHTLECSTITKYNYLPYLVCLLGVGA